MMIKLNVSAENSEYQIIESLKNNRTKRAKSGELFVEGITCIKQAYKAGLHFTRIIYPEGIKLSDWALDFIRRSKPDKIVEMSDHLFKKLCDKSIPSELVITAKQEIIHLDDIEPSSLPFFLICDRPNDLGNFGSIVRTANSFHVDAVLILGHSIDIHDPKVIRSSLGTVFFTPIFRFESITQFIEWITEMKSEYKMKLIGSDSTGEIGLESIRLRKPIAFILGNEAKGMSVNLRMMCDSIIKIPNLGDVNSLNVSCAGSIILWEIFKNSRSPE